VVEAKEEDDTPQKKIRDGEGGIRHHEGGEVGGRNVNGTEPSNHNSDDETGDKLYHGGLPLALDTKYMMNGSPLAHQT